MFKNDRRFSTRIGPPALLAALAFFGRPGFARGAAAQSAPIEPTSPAPPAISSGTPAASPPAASYGSAWKHVGDIWGKGGYELYLPVYTYHMPYAYTRTLLRSYNDFPYGAGLGKGRFNERGNWEGLFVMAFADSHDRAEYEGGYAWIAMWNPFDNRFRAGAGFTGFITARSDYNRYMPFPGVLPLGSIGFLNADLQCTFVPGLKNNGNVLFTWLKLSFY